MSFPFPNRMKAAHMSELLDSDQTVVVPFVRHSNGSIDYGTPRPAIEATWEQRRNAAICTYVEHQAAPVEPKRAYWPLILTSALYVAAFAALAWRATGVL